MNGTSECSDKLLWIIFVSLSKSLNIRGYKRQPQYTHFGLLSNFSLVLFGLSLIFDKRVTEDSGKEWGTLNNDNAISEAKWNRCFNSIASLHSHWENCHLKTVSDEYFFYYSCAYVMARHYRSFLFDSTNISKCKNLIHIHWIL